MKSKKNNNYFVLFQGAKLRKREANKAGIGIIFGLAGILITHFLPMGQSNIAKYAAVLLCAAIGYFWIANKIFKKREKKK